MVDICLLDIAPARQSGSATRNGVKEKQKEGEEGEEEDEYGSVLLIRLFHMPTGQQGW